MLLGSIRGVRYSSIVNPASNSIYKNTHFNTPAPYIIAITTLITRIEVSFQWIPTIAHKTAAKNPQKILIGYRIWKEVSKTHINAKSVPIHL